MSAEPAPRADRDVRAFEPPAPTSPPPPSARIVAMREHSLLSLFDLSRDLSVRLDRKRLADLVLFNLMGHFGTTQAALWLPEDDDDARMVPVRAHGLSIPAAAALGEALQADLGRWREHPDPILVSDSAEVAGDDVRDAASKHGVAALAPVPAQGGVIGFAALGRRVNGAPFSGLDLQILHASLGMAGAAFDNARLFRQVQQQNQRLEAANLELVELDRLKIEFLQNVNHELRTPLTVMTGSVECLLAVPEADVSRQRLLEGVRAQIERLSSMVESLLELTTLRGQASPVEPFDVRELLARYVERRGSEIAAGRRRLVVRPARSEAQARASLARVTQVLDLLLDNAIKFTPPGSRIELAAEEWQANGAAWVRVSFADDGPGIPQDQLERVFIPFFQIDGSSTRTAGGLGIGLALAQRIVTSMAGRIEVESAPGRGTTFHLLLPRA